MISLYSRSVQLRRDLELIVAVKIMPNRRQSMNFNTSHKITFTMFLCLFYEFSVDSWNISSIMHGLFSLIVKTSYRQISWTLEAARLDVVMVVSLWNLTGILAALLPRCLSNFRAIEKNIVWFWFTRNTYWLNGILSSWKYPSWTHLPVQSKDGV